MGQAPRVVRPPHLAARQLRPPVQRSTTVTLPPAAAPALGAGGPCPLPCGPPPAELDQDLTTTRIPADFGGGG